jgi:hypothetical protein
MALLSVEAGAEVVDGIAADSAIWAVNWFLRSLATSRTRMCKARADDEAAVCRGRAMGAGGRKEGRMHGRMARYTYSGDIHELARRAEEGMLPVFESQPGFKAYSIIESDGEIISFSAWESSEQADAANKAAASWVADNMAGEIDLKEARTGEILFSTTLGVSTKAGITA